MRGDFFGDGLGEVVPQVPAVADLDRVGQGSADRLGVGGRSVPAHGLDARMPAQPGFQSGGFPAGQHLDSLTVTTDYETDPNDLQSPRTQQSHWYCD